MHAMKIHQPFRKIIEHKTFSIKMPPIDLLLRSGQQNKTLFIEKTAGFVKCTETITMDNQMHWRQGLATAQSVWFQTHSLLQPWGHCQSWPSLSTPKGSPYLPMAQRPRLGWWDGPWMPGSAITHPGCPQLSQPWDPPNLIWPWWFP